MGDAYDDPDQLALLMGGKLPGDNAWGTTPPFLTPEQSAAMGAARRTGTFGPAATPLPGAAPPLPAASGGGAGAPSPVARVSDDPAVTGLPPIPKAPPPSPAPNIAGIQSLADQIKAASQPIQRSDYKPHWWERALSVPVAGIAGFGNEQEGIQAGQNVLHRRYDQAVAAQKAKLDPLYRQLEMQEKNVLPFYKQAHEETQSNYENQGHEYDRYLKTEEADNTVRQRAPRISYDKDGTPHFFYSTLGGKEYEGVAPAGWENSQTRQTEDQNTPAVGARPEKYLDPETKKPALRIKTKAGGYMPYAPKNIDEGAMYGDPTATSLYNRAHPGRVDAGEKPASKHEFGMVQNTRDKGWADVEKQYKKDLERISQPTKDEKPAVTKMRQDKLNQAREDYYDTRQTVQDEYEQGIEARGGQAEHVELPRNHFGETGEAPTGPSSGRLVRPGAQQAGATTPPPSISKASLQRAAKDHFGGDYNKARTEFLRKNPQGKVIE